MLRPSLQIVLDVELFRGGMRNNEKTCPLPQFSFFPLLKLNTYN
jgi:hypothetical protein